MAKAEALAISGFGETSPLLTLIRVMPSPNVPISAPSIVKVPISSVWFAAS